MMQGRDRDKPAGMGEADADALREARAWASMERLADEIVDGDLDLDRSREAFDLLRRVKGGARELGSLQRSVEALREPVSGPDFVGRVLGEVHDRKGFTSSRGRGLLWLSRVGIAAMVLVAAGVGFWSQRAWFGLSGSGGGDATAGVLSLSRSGSAGVGGSGRVVAAAPVSALSEAFPREMSESFAEFSRPMDGAAVFGRSAREFSRGFAFGELELVAVDLPAAPAVPVDPLDRGPAVPLVGGMGGVDGAGEDFAGRAVSWGASFGRRGLEMLRLETGLDLPERLGLGVVGSSGGVREPVDWIEFGRSARGRGVGLGGGTGGGVMVIPASASGGIVGGLEAGSER